MLLTTRGIIFRTVKYSETSVIADIFTEEKGLHTFIISGVRNPKSKVAGGLLQVCSMVEIVAYFRDDADMHRIKEIRSAYVYQSLIFDVKKGAVGLFWAEICQKTIRVREENRELFAFLFRSFQFLDDTQQSVSNLPIAFMVALSAFLGFLPNGEFETSAPSFDLLEGIFQETPPPHPHYLDEVTSKNLNLFLENRLESAHKILLNFEERKSLLRGLIEFYGHHIEHLSEIFSHQILHEVLV